MLKTKKKRRFTTFSLLLVVISLAIFCAFSLVLLLITNKVIIDHKSIDLLDMYIRASFVLIGSTLSGLVAFFIYQLQERGKEKEKEENENKHYESIKEEYKDNLEALDKISKMINQSSITELAIDIAEGQEVKEIFLTIYTQVDFTFYSDFLNELRTQKFNNDIKAFKKSFQIYKYLKIIVFEIEDKENIEKILELIKGELITMKELYRGTLTKPE
ncbi:hypothetical protein [Halobacillus sp. Marseille-Q1614]|uniref:hypothetical protein n=1 Tax=Halobacillus sp. Marseille-Q1614 TaxID=2709134 RepID=UPI00156EFD0B|nr:hypothetical protein [Halobacillus sp. Marseille-Q1614]